MDKFNSFNDESKPKEESDSDSAIEDVEIDEAIKKIDNVVNLKKIILLFLFFLNFQVLCHKIHEFGKENTLYNRKNLQRFQKSL